MCVVTLKRRSHQGRKPGTVIAVRKLASAEVPNGGIGGGSVCVTAKLWHRRVEGQRQRHRGAVRLRTFEGVEPMGRGRAKAKQVKVARQLKYNSGGTDLDRLRAELGVGTEARQGNDDDPYAAYDDEEATDEDAGDDEDDEDDEDDWSRSRS
jgi:hypothetical protein